tara:strand:- start:309 stop:473 length:165 start_codon:yes stop_codon:yes gene_type:complete
MDSITALWEIDLSPGTETWPEIELCFLARSFCLGSEFFIVIKPKGKFSGYLFIG